MAMRVIRRLRQPGATPALWMALTAMLFCLQTPGRGAAGDSSELERFRAVMLMRESMFESLSMKFSVDQRRYAEKDADTGVVTVSEGPLYDISCVLTSESGLWYDEQMTPRSQDGDGAVVRHLEAYDGEQAVQLFPDRLSCHIRSRPTTPAGVVPEEYLLLFGMRWSEVFENCTFSELERQDGRSVFSVTLNDNEALTARITVDTERGTVLKKETFFRGKGEIYWEYSDFREVEPGFLFPFESAEMGPSRSTEEPSGSDTPIKVIRVEALELNAVIPQDLFRPRIPTGYTVVDFVKQIQYVSGTTPVEIVDSLVNEAPDVAANDLLDEIALQPAAESDTQTPPTADKDAADSMPGPPALNWGPGATHLACFVLGVLVGALGLTAQRRVRSGFRAR